MLNQRGGQELFDESGRCEARERPRTAWRGESEDRAAVLECMVGIFLGLAHGESEQVRGCTA